MLASGRGNLAAVGLALVLALAATMSVANEGWTASPSGNRPMAVVPPPPVPPVKAKPVQPPPVQPRSGPIGNARDRMSRPPAIRSLNAGTCRSRCATACFNQTSCTDLNVAQCTAARQRCRLTCDSSC